MLNILDCVIIAKGHGPREVGGKGSRVGWMDMTHGPTPAETRREAGSGAG